MDHKARPEPPQQGISCSLLMLNGAFLMTDILSCKALKKLEGSTADVDLVNLDKGTNKRSHKVTSQEILTIVKVLQTELARWNWHNKFHLLTKPICLDGENIYSKIHSSAGLPLKQR